MPHREKYTTWIDHRHRQALTRMSQATGFSHAVLLGQALDEFLERTGYIPERLGNDYETARLERENHGKE